MHWYLIYTKPKQERSALQNLERQGYVCYLPLLHVEKLRRSSLEVFDEPLFPRYLFIQLGQGDSAKSWSPIRSTKGVSRLVSFGGEPGRLDDRLIKMLKALELVALEQPQRLFKPGQRVQLVEGAFSGLEGIYQMADGESRAMVLIELMTKTVPLSVYPANLRMVG